MIDEGKPEWLRHEEDEEKAIARQQVAAGATHMPVSGPGPYGDERVNALVSAAVQQERDRCAALVERAAADPVASAQLQGALRQLAADIRSLPSTL